MDEQRLMLIYIIFVLLFARSTYRYFDKHVNDDGLLVIVMMMIRTIILTVLTIALCFRFIGMCRRLQPDEAAPTKCISEQTTETAEGNE